MADSIMVQCTSESGRACAIEIEPKNRFYGWVFYKHPDGQWVTLRQASEEEIESARRHQKHVDRMSAYAARFASQLDKP